MPRPSHVETSFLTSSQRLDHAVKSYWQRRFPGKPGRVLIVDRARGV